MRRKTALILGTAGLSILLSAGACEAPSYSDNNNDSKPDPNLRQCLEQNQGRNC